MLRIFLILMLAGGLAVGGCSKKEKPRRKQRGYLETVVHSKDIGENIKVGENMGVILTQLKMYEISNDGYPESLDEMDISSSALVGADGETPLVYLRPDKKTPADAIILYDPVGLEKKHYVLTLGGVKKVSSDELSELTGANE